MLTSLPRDIMSNVVVPYLNVGDFCARALALSHDSRSTMTSHTKTIKERVPIEAVLAHPSILFDSVIIGWSLIESHAFLLTNCTELTVDIADCWLADENGRRSPSMKWLNHIPPRVTSLRICSYQWLDVDFDYFPPSVTKLEFTCGALFPSPKSRSYPKVTELHVMYPIKVNVYWPSVTTAYFDFAYNMHFKDVEALSNVNLHIRSGAASLLFSNRPHIITEAVQKIKSLHLQEWNQNLLPLESIPVDFPFYVNGERIDTSQETVNKKRSLEGDDEPAGKRQRT